MPGQQHQTTPTTSTAPATTGNTSQSTGSGRGNSASADTATGTATCDDTRLNDLFDAIDHSWEDLMEARQQSVERLTQDATQVDPPPAWQTIALAVGTVALAAATAGVGTAVAGAVVAVSAKVATQVVKAAVDKGLNTAITGALGAATGGSDEEVRNQFFRAQSDSLLQGKSVAQQAFITSGRQAIRQGDDPCGAAEQLRAALVGALATAGEIQRQKTLASWCNFQARGELGTDGSGDDTGVNLGAQIGDTSAKGVLGLEVAAPSGRGSVTVVDAEIEGLNETLRGDLSSRPISSLGIAVTVHGEVNPPSWYESRSADGIIRFGENESGQRWARNSPGGTQWLMWKGIGGPVMTGPEGFHPDEAERDRYVWQGIAQVLDNEIKPRSLRSMGVTLDG